MSNYSTLKNDIDNNIFENQTQQITGAALNSILKEMVNTLGEGYQFGGIVTPESSVPTSDAKLFFVACTEGEYNFVDEVGDHIEVAEGEVAIIYGNRKAVIAPSKWLTLINDVPFFSYDESDPITLAEQMGHSIEDVLAKGFVVYNDDVTTNHYVVIGDYGAEGGNLTFVGNSTIYQIGVNGNGYINGYSQIDINPRNLISKDSLMEMLDALKDAGVISNYTMTWDAEAGKYAFTFNAN